MTETDIDSALLDLIVREVVRRLRGGTAVDGTGAGVAVGRMPSIVSQRADGGADGKRGRIGSGPTNDPRAASLHKAVIVEEDVRLAAAEGARSIRIDHRAIVTPLARDTAREKNLAIERVDFGEASAGEPGPDVECHAGLAVNVAVGSTPEGQQLTEAIVRLLTREGHSVTDAGRGSCAGISRRGDNASCDGRRPAGSYRIPQPQVWQIEEVARRVAHEVASGHADWGIVVDGLGVLPAAVANRTEGVVAVACATSVTARAARDLYGANILCLGAQVVGERLALDIVEAWTSARPA